MPNPYKLLIVLVLDVGSIIINIASQMTLALDFLSRCQCKKLISVYLALLYFSDGYSICEVWDGPYSRYPKGSPLKEL